MRDWISVKDRLPEENVKVLSFVNSFASTEYGECKIDYIINFPDRPIWASILERDQNKVSHWMPLPQFPKDI